MNAIVQPLGQPAPGAAKVGNLYADLQSRTLWLGVSLAVDATGSVLISDMLSQIEMIIEAESNANAYTDAQLTLYAKKDSPVFTGNPRAPTQPAADNDDSLATTAFVKAAIAASTAGKFLTGMIMMYRGSLLDIGVGALAGWALCDGANGTPDLRDKFVMGAGNVATYPGGGSVNAILTATSNVAGAHTHPVSNVALTLAQMPAHTHLSGTLGGVVTGAGGAGGAHAHVITCCSTTNPASPDLRPLLQRAGTLVNMATDTEPAHNHPGNNAVVDINSGASASSGSSTTHTHTTDSRGDHNHTITAVEMRKGIPWVALAYIMKL